MKKQPSDLGLFEAGFDGDIAPEQLEQLIKVFSSEQAVHSSIMSFRRKMGYVDMKRGELYPEVIGGVSRLRRTIAQAYDVERVQAQPNFACNGCIDALMIYLRISWSAQRCSQLADMLKEARGILDEGERPKAKLSKEISEALACVERPTLVVASPTYFRYYSATESKRIRLVCVPYERDYSYPLQAIMNVIQREAANGLILVSPNNPTGLPIPDDTIEDLLSKVPDDFIVALDRTCANTEPEIPTEKLIARFPKKRLVVFHSFSKYHSMSHIRIGFSVLSNKGFAEEVELMLPFGLNLEGILKATKILSNGPLRPQSQVLDNIRSNQVLLKDWLQGSDSFRLSPFTSNYALLKLPNGLTSDVFASTMMSEGIFVMPGHEFPEPDPTLVRIHTGGMPETTERMLDAANRRFSGR